jgi:TolA-binding protein
LKRSSGNDQRRQYFISQAELGALKTEGSYLISRNAPKEHFVAHAQKFKAFADSHRENDLILEALLRGGELSYKHAFDLELAHALYEACTKRSNGYNERARDAYFAMEEIALIRSDFASAMATLNTISDHLDKRNRPEDTDVRKRITFEHARLAYYHGQFDTALSQLTAIAEDAESDQSNDAIALKGFIEDNRDATDVSIKLYVKADQAALAREYPTAISALRTIRESAPNAPVADDALLRESELLVKTGDPQEAIKILEIMQTKMSLSPLVDRAGFKIAEITELELKQPQVAQRLYEEFLERYSKSSLVAEARKRARRLRGDAF